MEVVMTSTPLFKKKYRFFLIINDKMQKCQQKVVPLQRQIERKYEKAVYHLDSLVGHAVGS